MRVAQPGGIAAVVVVLAAAVSATADVSIDLHARDPVAALPVVSADKLNFLRAFRRWRPGCKKPDILVENGGIDSGVSEPQYSQIPLVGGCGEPVDAYAGNLSAINESMRATQCGTAALRGKLAAKLPASFVADGLQVEVTGNSSTALVTINPLARRAGAWTGGRRMGTGVRPLEVRGWYLVDTEGQRQLAVLLAGKEPDGTVAEQWMEVWAGPVAKKPTALAVARTWLLALAARDAAVLAELSAVPFERGGLDPIDGPLLASCPKTRIAKKPAQLADVLACALADAPARYRLLFDDQELTTTSAAKLPATLKAHKKALTALAGKGHTLVRFSVEDEGWSIDLVLAIKAGKVAAAVEAASR